MRIVLESAAQTDLREISEYFEREAGPRVAKRILLRLRDRLKLLEQWPEIGPARPNLGPGRRILVCRPHVAVYSIRDRQVRVLRILHGARDIEAIMADDDPPD